MARTDHHIHPRQDPFAPLAPVRPAVNPHDRFREPTARQEMAEVMLGLLGFGLFLALVLFFAGGL